MDEDWPWGTQPRGFFREFDDSFRRMREEMNELFERARKGELESPEKGGPYVYGWSMRMGPDGVPHIEEFGNTKGIPPAFRSGLPSGREPLVDVIETESEVKVIAELPGVEKSDVDLETTEKRLAIKVDTERRKYYKDVDLPTHVDVESAKANYNNGVLEVVLTKKAKEPEGTKIDIE
jgi:HSP20 family protein